MVKDMLVRIKDARVAFFFWFYPYTDDVSVLVYFGDITSFWH